MDLSPLQIEHTLEIMYKDAEHRNQANEYLRLAQLSPEAWQFSWELLKPYKSLEVQFFGASTLHIKVSNFWKELNGEQMSALRSQLLQALLDYSAGPKIVLTRICLAFSAFIIRTISESWPNAVTDVLTTLKSTDFKGSIDPRYAMLALIELLTVLPEEFYTINIASNQKGIIRSLLESSLPQVMALVQEIVFSVPTSDKVGLTWDLSQMGLKCFASWCQLDAAVVEQETLLSGILALTQHNDLCQSALEAVGHVATHPDSHKYPNFILRLIEKIGLCLDPLISKAVQDKEMDICCSAYSLLVSIGETHSRLILDSALTNEKLEQKETVIKLIQLLLQCSGTPGQFPTEEICSEQAFSFWYIFQDDIVASEPDKYQKYLLMFHSVFMSLVDTYLVKVRFPIDDEYNQWNSEEKESFRCYRQDIGDSFMYCYTVLRETMLASLMSHLQIATNIAAQKPSEWQYLEACLFGFYSVAENIDSEDNSYLTQFFSILPSLPLNHVRIISTTMDTIGTYAEWINAHSNVLSQVIPLLLLGLKRPEMAQSATMALKDISRDCKPTMKPFAEQILSTAREVLCSNDIKPREKVRLMCTVGNVLSIMPLSYIMPYLEVLLSPMMQEFHHILEQEPTPSLKANLWHYLNIFSVLFASLDVRQYSLSDDETESTQQSVRVEGPQPVLLLLQQLMPSFGIIGAKWNFDNEIVMLLCDALKRAITTLLEDSWPFVPHICQLLVQFFVSKPQNTSTLDIAKQLFLLFGKDNELQPQLGAFLVEIISHTLNICQNDLPSNTFVAEVFYTLLHQILKKIPSMLVYCGNLLPVIFQCSIATIALPEKATVKITSSFISEFINQSRDNPIMLDIINSQGEELVTQVLRVIGGKSPRALVEHMTDILMALNKKYFDNLCRWLYTHIQQDGFPSDKVTAEQKENFTRQVLKEKANKRRLKETIIEFGLMCRGLFGTQYGMETFSSAL